jgi:hypothetical protein
MTTQAQILANRQNAQKSTGPKMAEGKAVSAQNATKHGLFAQENVVIPENQAQFDALREEMLADLAPVGAMEAILAERIVSLTWRLKRAARMQDEVIDVKIRSEINSSKPLLSKSLMTGQPSRLSRNTKRCYDDLALGLVTKWDFAGDRVLERLSMYERRFEASLFKTMAELKKLQVARKRDQAEEIEKASTEKGPETIFEGRVEKQSQSGVDQEELTPFKKKEYELLIGTPSRSNKANDPQPKAGFKDPKTENRPRRKAGVCRY